MLGNYPVRRPRCAVSWSAAESLVRIEYGPDANPTSDRGDDRLYAR